MIAGLPWASWALLLASVLVPLALVLRYHRVHSRPGDARPTDVPGGRGSSDRRTSQGSDG